MQPCLGHDVSQGDGSAQRPAADQEPWFGRKERALRPLLPLRRPLAGTREEREGGREGGRGGRWATPFRESRVRLWRRRAGGLAAVFDPWQVLSPSYSVSYPPPSLPPSLPLSLSALVLLVFRLTVLYSSSPFPFLFSSPPPFPQVAPHVEGAVSVLAEGLVGRMRVEPIRAGETAGTAEVEKLGKSLLPSLPPTLPPCFPPSLPPLLPATFPPVTLAAAPLELHESSVFIPLSLLPSLPPSLPPSPRPSHTLPVVHPTR